MVPAKDQLALKLLSTERWTDQARRDLAATVLMITTSSVDVLLAGLDRLDRRVVRIDEELLTSLYARSSLELRVTLINTVAFSRLPPATFSRLFRSAWKNPRLSDDQRMVLAGRVPGGSRLRADARSFRDIVLELLWSPRRGLCLLGLALAGSLNDLSPRDLDRIKSRLTSRWWDHRTNALNGLWDLVKRHRELSPALVESATSPQVRKTAGRLLRADPEKDVRTCAHYLLKAIREYDVSLGGRGYPRRRR